MWTAGYLVSYLGVSKLENSCGAGWISYEEDMEEAT